MNAEYIDANQELIAGVPGEGSAKNISPHQRLLAAVLLQARDDYGKYQRATEGEGARIREELEVWLQSGSTEDQSFCWYCAVLGLEAEYVRRLFYEAAGKTSRPAAAA